MASIWKQTKVKKQLDTNKVFATKSVKKIARDQIKVFDDNNENNFGKKKTKMLNKNSEETL